MLYLLAEAADVVELSGRGDEGILALGHGFRNPKKIPLDELQRAADAVGDRAGNILLLGGGFGSRLLERL